MNAKLEFDKNRQNSTKFDKKNHKKMILYILN